MINIPPGAYHHETVEIANKGPIPKDDELVKEAGRRFIEEAVELALATGLSAADVLVHVTDAIHNEARKAKRYPSEMFGAVYAHPGNLKVEIIDVIICTDYIREAAQLDVHEMIPALDEKLELLRLRAEAGHYVMVGKRIYKKEARS